MGGGRRGSEREGAYKSGSRLTVRGAGSAGVLSPRRRRRIYIYTRQRRFFEILFSSSSLDGSVTGNRPGRAPDVDAGLSGLAVLFPRASVVSPRVQARGQPRRWKERSWASLVVLPRSVPPHKERSRPSSPPPCSSSPRLVTHARGSRGCRCTQTTLLPPRLSFYPCLIGSRWSAGQC